MKKEFGYIQLMKALNNNELYEYLVAELKYIIPFDRNFDLRTDFQSMITALNVYGEENLEFEEYLRTTIINGLCTEKRAGSIYCIANVINHHLMLELRHKNCISSIDDELIALLKEKIHQNKDYFKTCKRYKAFNNSNGMMGVFYDWDEQFFDCFGKHNFI